MSTTWVAYVKAGKEIEVAETLTEQGINTRCAQKAEMVRTGKNRRAEMRLSPVLPNYVFVTCGADDYLTVVGAKYVASAMVAIPQGSDCKMVDRFLDAADRELYETKARIEAGERIDEYNVGQSVKIIDGPFSGFLASYRGIVETLDPLFPELEAEIDMMGRVVKATVDPLHVRAVE